MPAALDPLDVAYTTLLGPSPRDPADLAGAVWDLGAVAAAYREFADTLPEVSTVTAAEPVAAYALRCELVHRWRTFLFVDPDLPADALPSSWPGHDARDRFLACAAALAPATDDYVDRTLSDAAGPTRTIERAEAPP